MHPVTKTKSIAIFQVPNFNPIRAYKYLKSYYNIMTLRARIYFFNLFTFYFVLIDPHFWSCATLYGKLLNILHQYICSALLFLGPLFGYYTANILFIVFAVAGWRIYGSCFLTVETNRVCDDPQNTRFHNCPYQVKRLATIISGSDITSDKISSSIDHSVLALIVLYNLYMLYRTYYK